MTTDRWEQVEALFEQAQSLPPEQRTAFLAEACGDDEELRREIESLLASFEQAPAFFEELAERTVRPTLDVPGLLRPGTRVGAYGIVREIGQGGMGTVYLGERADGQFEQQVAIKLLHRTADPDSVRRFRAERQILASLSHPNIAHLLDAGVTEAGVPYLVMEYADGQPITSYCDENRLSINERLHLFGKVCEAVRYAHTHLIIHRDLKPSNILVTEEGEVKLLDFGIAKLLEEDESPREATRTEQRVLTPEYAAPEQVRGERVTTSADVYALGVLLFELLTGHRPYRLEKKLRHEAERTILEEEPLRPSAVVTHTEQRARPDGSTQKIGPEEVAAARDLPADRLQRCLAGDLDTIVLMALRKEPERRYPGVESLWEDVRRHLSGLPVRARGDAFSYRARRFISRHKAGVAASALTLAALFVGLGVALWQADVARQERDRAQLEAQKAEQIATFASNLFLSSDPETAGDSRLTVREVLNRSAHRVEEELRGQPEVQASLMRLIGHAYTGLGLYGQAEPLLRKAVEIVRTLPDVPVRTRVEVEGSLAYLLFRQGQYAEAERLYRDAIARLEAAFGPDGEGVATAYNNLALMLTEVGRLEEAGRLYRHALGLEPGNAEILHNLGTVLEEQEQFDEAVLIHRRALDLIVRARGPESTHAASAMNALASALHRKGEYAEADSLYARSLALRRRLLPAGHPHLASSLLRYGWLRIDQGRAKEAEAMIREGEAILTRALPPHHWQNAAARSLLGLALAKQGRVREGLPLLTWSYELYRRTLGPDNWRTKLTAQIIAGLYTQIGQPGEAARYAES